MKMDVRYQSLIFPFVFTVLGLAILIGLGTWQMQRMAWKAGLIAMVEARLALEPIAFPDLVKRDQGGEDMRYTPVKVTGVFNHEQERHYFLPLGSQVGWHILTPLRIDTGEIVFVNRGFVPDKLKVQTTRLAGLPEGRITIEGLARHFGTKGLFTPDNDASSNQWFWLDKKQLYASLSGYQGGQYGFLIDARKTTGGSKWPKAGVTRVKFQDKHFGYALTWYGLALTLLGVFCAFAYGRFCGLKK